MRKGGAESKTAEIQTTVMEESRKDLVELHQANNERQRLAEHWMEEIIQLKLALAGKDEELSKSNKRWQMGTLDHVEVVKQLSSERAKLDRYHQKCAALEESHLKQLQEMQEAHRREIFDMKQQFKKALTQQEQRHLQEISELEERSKEQLLEQEKRFAKELDEKDEQMKLQLSLHEDIFKRILRDKMAMFNQERADLEEEMKKQLLLNEEIRKKELSDELAKVNQERTNLEEAMKSQLSDKEKSLKTTMALLCHQWRVREQQWHQQKQQLEEMLEEQEMTRQWLVLASKIEIHHLREKILQLKVRGCG